MFMNKKRGRPRGRSGFARTVPLRIRQDMEQAVRELALKSRLSDADIMRMAIERGLGAVERMFAEPEKEAA